MSTCLDGPWRLALLVIAATTCLAGCKDEEDKYTGPVYDPIRLKRKTGIGDIEFSEDGRKFCFIDAKANVGVVDLESGQVLWSRSTSEWADDAEWAACVFLNDAGDVVASHVANGKRVSIVPADPDEPIMLFETEGEWSDPDYARLSKAFVENRHTVDLSSVEQASNVDPEALRQDLDLVCEGLTFDPEIWQKLWALCAQGPWESDDPSVLASLLKTVERAAREQVFRDRTLASRLVKMNRTDTVGIWVGVADVHGQRGVLASLPNPKSMLSVYSPHDGHLMWWFVAPPTFEIDDYRRVIPDRRLLASLRVGYPKFHRYIDRETIKEPVMPGAGMADFLSGRAQNPSWLGMGRKDGRAYIYMGGRNMPGYNFLNVGMLENDIDIDWRTLETRGVQNFAADGFQLLVLYAKGRIALWDISKEGGGDPKLLAKGQAVESTWREDETAVGYRDGHGVVSVNDQYWVIRKNKVKGPFRAEGRITAIAIRPPYWVYGTADGKIIFDRLD